MLRSKNKYINGFHKIIDDCLEFRVKVVTAEAGELIYRLSSVKDFF